MWGATAGGGVASETPLRTLLLPPAGETSSALLLLQGIANICAQLVGSLLASGLLYGTTPDPGSSSLGANAGVSADQA